MKHTVDGNMPVNSGSNIKSGLSRYKIAIKFIGKSNISTQLSVFDAIKKLGTFSIQDQQNHVYILDFKSEFTKDGMEGRLKEIASPDKLFDYTVEKILRV